jgi:hypothetical protein
VRALVTAAERDVLYVIDISALEIDFVRFELLSEFLRPIFSVLLTSFLDLLSLSRQIFRVDPGLEIIRAGTRCEETHEGSGGPDDRAEADAVPSRRNRAV